MSVQSHYAGMPLAGEAVPVPGVPVGGIVAALRRSWIWIVLPVLFATAAAVLWLSSVTPLYRSTSKVLVENQETAYTRPSATTEERVLLDQESIKSQVQLLLSSDLSRRIVRELGLDKLPEFNPKSAPSLPSRVLSLFGVTRDPASLTNEEGVLEKYYEQLTVYQVDTSRVIAIEFSSQSAELAARVANAVADGYIDMQKSAKRDATREASDWLSGQIATLSTRVDTDERKVEDYRSEHGLFSANRGTAQPQTLTDQQLGELTTQIALARVQMAQAQAKARLVRELLDSGRLLESSEILNSPLIQSLISRQVLLRAQVAELSATLGPRHPRMQQLNAQLGDLRRQIRAESTKYADATEADAEISAERVQQLVGSLDTLKTSAAKSNVNEVELRALERDAKSQRDLLESLLARYRDATAREDLDALPADARLISTAAPAAEPYFPKTMATLLAAFLGSLVLSCGVVITLELARSASEYPAVGPVPTAVGDMPQDTAARVEPRSVENQSVESQSAKSPSVLPPTVEPESDEAKNQTPLAKPETEPGFAPIRDEILAHSQGDTAYTVLFTSVRRIGNLDDLAMRLARAVSAEGRRVVIVNTDFADMPAPADKGSSDPDGETSDPDVGDVDTGLGELLIGKAEFETVIQRDEASRVHMISAGQVESDPLILISSDRMETMLDALRHTYDVVILLAPAVVRRGEARVLARRADYGVLLAGGAVGEASSQRACGRLQDAGLVNITILKVDTGNEGPRLSVA